MNGVRHMAQTRTTTALVEAGIPRASWFGINQTDRVVDIQDGQKVTYNELIASQLANNPKQIPFTGRSN